MILLNIDSSEKQFAFSYIPNYLHIQIHTYHKLSQHVADSGHNGNNDSVSRTLFYL
jgi:hypothetical protein